jgi:hypothetical protein
MDYLKQHNLASVPALFVVSRYLVTRPAPVEESELRRALQPRPIGAENDSFDQPPEKRDVLPASLAVGMDLGLLEKSGRRWAVRVEHRDELLARSATGAQAFPGLVLRLLGKRSLDAVDAKEQPPDVAIGLTWLLLRDPLAPFFSRWGAGAEKAFDRAGLGSAVKTEEQWRALVRWARSLGLATLSAEIRGRSSLFVDPTTAIRHVLHLLPRQASAERWLRELHKLIPLLGEPRLLPGSSFEDDVSGSTAMALLKLGKAGLVQLIPTDDSPSAVALRLGSQTHRVGEIHVLKAAS